MVRGNLLMGEPKFVHPRTRQEIMKLTTLLKTKFNNSTQLAAKAAGISDASMRNFKSQDREVLELANGDYIIVSKHTVIIKVKGLNND